MINPWLNIPASDYEGHMSSPNVGQLSFLAKTFKESLENHDCRAVALLGCATGNGLEYIKNEVSHRVTAVDINPEYLKILRQRFGNSIRGLEIVRDDLAKCQLEENAYTLIFAGLVFEYLDPQILLQKIAKWLRVDGILVTVLQQPTDGGSVTETPYTSLKSLNSIMNLIDRKQFKIIATDIGLMAIGEKIVTLETGKSFYIGTYQRNNT